MAISTSIAERLSVVRSEVAAACERADRDPSEVTIVGITKTHPARVVGEAIAAGLLDLGENRAQELVPKAEAAATAGLRPRWHFVGQLQRNKVKAALPHIDVLHSLDSARLAEEIDLRAEKPLACYLEVNVAAEGSKGGVTPAEVGALLSAVSGFASVQVAGLMTVAPQVADPEQVRPVFRELSDLASAHGLSGLSMGMTEDYAVAIEEGATLVRVGRAIFGPRAG